MFIPKPTVCEDVKRRGSSSCRPLEQRLNLGKRRVIRIPLLLLCKALIGSAAFIFLITGSATAPTTTQTHAAADTLSASEERKALETQLKELEDQIEEYEGQVLNYQKQGRTLKDEINRLNSKISKLNLQIKAINFTLSDLDSKIVSTESQIGITEDNIRTNRNALARLLRDIYQNEQETLLEIFLQRPTLSDFFGDLNNITLLQGNLRVALGKIVTLHQELTEQKDQLSVARADAATIKEYQAAQKTEVEKTKQQKDDILTQTKGQESKYKTLLQETQKTAKEIRSRIFRLLGGGELSFEEAYQYAKLAAGATGIREAFILAVLDRESALGQNVGRCSYRNAMSPKNQPLFLQITRELNIDPDSIQVSCANADGVYGGAMGPAQFIASTWMLYRDRVSQITGNSPASPWNNADAFVATALYLKDAYDSRSCREYSEQIPAQSNILRERCAAARYYAGSRWYSYRWAYGEPVVQKAIQFQQDINTITS